jgi:hypothetical protein
VATNSCISVAKIKNQKFEDAAIETEDCEKKLPFICEVKILENFREDTANICVNFVGSPRS